MLLPSPHPQFCSYPQKLPPHSIWEVNYGNASFKTWTSWVTRTLWLPVHGYLWRWCHPGARGDGPLPLFGIQPNEWNLRVIIIIAGVASTEIRTSPRTGVGVGVGKCMVKWIPVIGHGWLSEPAIRSRSKAWVYRVLSACYISAGAFYTGGEVLCSCMYAFPTLVALLGEGRKGRLDEWVCWYVPIIPALGRKQKEQRFRIIIYYILCSLVGPKGDI